MTSDPTATIQHTNLQLVKRNQRNPLSFLTALSFRHTLSPVRDKSSAASPQSMTKTPTVSRFRTLSRRPEQMRDREIWRERPEKRPRLATGKEPPRENGKRLMMKTSGSLAYSPSTLASSLGNPEEPGPLPEPGFQAEPAYSIHVTVPVHGIDDECSAQEGRLVPRIQRLLLGRVIA